MTDHELEQGLRALYRADVADEVAPASLYASLSEITQASTPAWAIRRRAWVLLAAALLLAVSAAVVAAGLLRLPKPPDLRFTSPLVFTTSEGGSLHAVDGIGAEPRTIVDGTANGIQISPDGQYVLFEGTGPGRTLSRTDGSSSRTFPDGAWTASWAPDSHAVAMATGQGDQMTLMIVDVDGGEPLTVPVPSRDDPSLAWSPDNVHLAYTGSEPADPNLGCATIASMLVVDIRSGQISEFGLYPTTSPVWSHDGRRVAAAVWPEGVDPEPCMNIPEEGLALAAVDTVTGDISTVTTADYFTSVAWSADDRSILTLIGADSRGGLEIARAPTEGAAVERLARIAPNWPVSSFFTRGSVWSADGSHLAWTGLDDGATETYGLWAIDLADGQPRRIAKDVLGYADTSVQPLWSPDGAWIAFYREPSGPMNNYQWPDFQRVGKGSIWIVRPDGSDEQLVVDDTLGVDVGRADW